MSQCGLDAENLDEEVVARFVDGHLPQCRCPFPVRHARGELRAALGHLLAVLRANAVIPARVLETTPVDEESNSTSSCFRVSGSPYSKGSRRPPASLAA